jgi:2-dehydro-3-deoxyphosphogluconate aldolase/(4S)-4-hydroxy-2-oxoglutarate aldolase
MTRKVGNSSTFLDAAIEVTHTPFYGKHGHLGFACYSVDRTAYYLQMKGFTLNEESVKRDQSGAMKSCYFNEEIAGFAFHLVKG